MYGEIRLCEGAFGWKKNVVGVGKMVSGSLRTHLFLRSFLRSAATSWVRRSGVFNLALEWPLLAGLNCPLKNPALWRGFDFFAHQ
jgi:hypothetical protein